MKTKKKSYTINMIEENGKTSMNRICDGFNALELLGILELAREEIIKQMRCEIKPDIIKRTFIED